MAKLLVQESTGVREFELVDNEVNMGRELDNALRISDPSISRHHALVRRTDFGFEILDLGSSNGVLLNGVKVQTSLLADGDRITLGQIQISFSDPKSAVQEEPASPLGTVRISPDEMRKVHAGQAPVPSASRAPQPVPSAPRIVTPSAQASVQAPSLAITVSQPSVSDEREEIDTSNPAPAWLRSWLPSLTDVAQPVMIDGVPERGDFVTRLLAHLMDMAPLIVVGIVCGVLEFVLGVIPAIGWILALLVGAVAAIVFLAYFFFFLPWCWTNFGGTPGKKLMKLRIVPEDDCFDHINRNTAYMRLLGHICNFGIGYLLVFGAERKGLQDILSKSICIKVDR